MKKNWVKRGISLLLTSALMISLTACGNDDGNGGTGSEDSMQQANAEAAKQGVYRYEEFDIQLEGYDEYGLSTVKEIDGQFYALVDGYSYGDNFYSLGKLVVIFDKNGQVQSQTNIEVFSKYEKFGDMEYDDVVTEDLARMAVTEEVVEESVSVDKTETETDTYINTAEILNSTSMVYLESQSTYDFSDSANFSHVTNDYLVNMDFDGNEKWRLHMNEFIPEGAYFYANSMLIDGEENVIIFTYDTVYIVDNGGNLLSTASSQTYFNNGYVDSNGQIRVFHNGVDYTKLYTGILNLQTGQVEEEKEIDNILMRQVNSTHNGSGTSYDVIAITSNGFSGYNIETDTAETVFSFINSDILASGINFICLESDDVFYGEVVNNQYNDGSMVMLEGINKKSISYGKFTKVQPEDIPDKEMLSIGTLYTDYTLKEKVINFNKSNSEYRINIIDYNEYNTASDYQGGTKQFNNDLLAGKVPDVMLVSNDIAISNYVSKGVFMNLYDLMDEDPELSRDDFLVNILEAYEIDGALYQIMPTFSIETVVAKSKWVGDKEYITIGEINDIVATMPEGAAAFEMGMDRSNVMRMYLMSNHNYFIDQVTGKCNFESQEFLELLAFLNTLPTEEEFINMWESGMMFDYDYQGQWQADQTLFKLCSVGDLSYYKADMERYMGKDYTLIGLPSIDSNGSIINAYQTFAISAKTNNKEGAWEFIKSYFTPESLETYTWQMPILKESFDIVAQRASEPPYYINNDGNKVEYNHNYYVNGEEVIIEPLTQEELAKIVEFITSVNKTAMFDYEIFMIIEEEVDAYYTGQKSAEEVAKIIQSRVQIFVDENR